MVCRIVIFGDSHVDAIKQALRKRPKTDELEISALRVARMKAGTMIGDLSVDDAVTLAGSLGEHDLLALAVGGNQHQIFGLVRHPEAFDFFEPGGGDVRPDHAVIPYRALRDIFEGGLRGRDYATWKRVVDGATRCRVLHLTPVPPKADEAHIRRRLETAFVEQGLAEKGITPAEIRLKIWRLQVSLFRAICDEEALPLLPPPPDTQTDEGFLRPEYYADDATHANASYGELLLRRLETIASSRPEAGDLS